MMMQIVFLSVAHQCLHALFVIQNAFSKAEVLRSDLQKLVICQKLQALFQTQSSGRNQTKSLVRVFVSCFFLQTLTVISSCFGH